MNRRNFLALAGTAIVVPVAEPVRRYFFAPAAGWYCPGTLLSPAAMRAYTEFDVAITQALWDYYCQLNTMGWGTISHTAPAAPEAYGLPARPSGTGWGETPPGL
jgi:hypothetical protein